LYLAEGGNTFLRNTGAHLYAKLLYMAPHPADSNFLQTMLHMAFVGTCLINLHIKSDTNSYNNSLPSTVKFKDKKRLGTTSSTFNKSFFVTENKRLYNTFVKPSYYIKQCKY
jgi:hypothetical protein